MFALDGIVGSSAYNLLTVLVVWFRFGSFWDMHNRPCMKENLQQLFDVTKMEEEYWRVGS